MLLVFQRVMERALALHAPIKVCYIRKDNQIFCFQKNGYLRKQENSFQELAMMKLNRFNSSERNATSLEIYGAKQ